jgi:TusE/DsrC/DsvC family sulfur relay protein
MVETSALDEEGFLIDPDLWTEELSKKMAEKQFNMVLTDLHMKIIHYMRAYYMKWDTLPILLTISKEFNLKSRELDEMFKRGNSTSRGVICKLGGLPKMLCMASGC